MVDTVFKFISLPTPTSYHKKFLLVTQRDCFDINTPATVKKEVFHVSETYLESSAPGAPEVFIRKVGKNDSYIYNHEVRLFQDQQRILKRRQLSAREYIEMLDHAAAGCKELKKFRQCFIFEQQYFMVETFLNLDQQPSILRIETAKDQSEITLPSWLTIYKEVT